MIFGFIKEYQILRRQFVKLSLAGLASLMVPVKLLKANTIDIDALKKAAALLNDNKVPPIVIDGKQYYVAYISGHEFRVPVSSMRI